MTDLHRQEKEKAAEGWEWTSSLGCLDTVMRRYAQPEKGKESQRGRLESVALPQHFTDNESIYLSDNDNVGHNIVLGNVRRSLYNE